MSKNSREALRKKLNAFIPIHEDEVARARLIREYVLIFTDEEVIDLLNGKKSLYSERGREIYLP
ncbi:MAG: hypothetical protein AABX84_00845 [Nanoarchaeota archaeon]